MTNGSHSTFFMKQIHVTQERWIVWCCDNNVFEMRMSIINAFLNNLLIHCQVRNAWSLHPLIPCIILSMLHLLWSLGWGTHTASPWTGATKTNPGCLIIYVPSPYSLPICCTWIFSIWNDLPLCLNWPTTVCAPLFPIQVWQIMQTTVFPVWTQQEIVACSQQDQKKRGREQRGKVWMLEGSWGLCCPKQK